MKTQPLASLYTLVDQADTEDLDVLVDYITDKGEGRISLSSETKEHLVTCKLLGKYGPDDRRVIAQEVLEFGGNTMGNFYRSMRNKVSPFSMLDTVLPDARSNVGYAEIVRDVAKHLKVDAHKDADLRVVEDAMLRKILRDSFEKMAPEEKKALLDEVGDMDVLWGQGTTAGLIALGRMGGFSTYKIAAIVANGLSKLILGRGLSFKMTGALMKVLKFSMGPIGWAITGIWTVADLSSPAYRVTVPCVIQLSYMRQKAIAKEHYAQCEDCGAMAERNAKFCGGCGKAMEAVPA